MSSNAFLQVVRHVVGDMAEPFAPRVAMTVYYGKNLLINGGELKASVVGTAPRVLIGGKPNELYTLVVFDLDAPNPNEPSLQDFIFWIVTNIPGGMSCAQGTEHLSYEAPNPQVGIHRTVFVVYKQASQLDGIEVVASRECFDTHGFASKHNLGKPVAVAYFNVRREAKKRKNRA